MKYSYVRYDENSSEILILNPKEALGILDLRSLGYHKIKQRVLQQNLSRFYDFKLAEKVCNQFNNIILRNGRKIPMVR